MSRFDWFPNPRNRGLNRWGPQVNVPRVGTVRIRPFIGAKPVFAAMNPRAVARVPVIGRHLSEMASSARSDITSDPRWQANPQFARQEFIVSQAPRHSGVAYGVADSGGSPDLVGGMGTYKFDMGVRGDTRYTHMGSMGVPPLLPPSAPPPPAPGGGTSTTPYPVPGPTTVTPPSVPTPVVPTSPPSMPSPVSVTDDEWDDDEWDDGYVPGSISPVPSPPTTIPPMVFPPVGPSKPWHVPPAPTSPWPQSPDVVPPEPPSGRYRPWHWPNEDMSAYPQVGTGMVERAIEAGYGKGVPSSVIPSPIPVLYGGEAAQPRPLFPDDRSSPDDYFIPRKRLGTGSAEEKKEARRVRDAEARKRKRMESLAAGRPSEDEYGQLSLLEPGVSTPPKAKRIRSGPAPYPRRSSRIEQDPLF